MKTAVVLGISGKLGSAIAHRLADEGYKVIGTSKEHDLPMQMFPKNSVTVHKMDMASIESIDSFLVKIEQVDEIDFLTNTISNTLTLERFEKIEMGTFIKEFEINLFNYIYLLKKLIPKMKEGANILFILSEMVLQPQKNFSPYITSKYALLGLMKSLKEDLEPRKIRVNAVSPSKMNTEFLWKMDLSGKIISMPAAIKEKQLKTQKFLAPEKVADKIMEIVKDSSINGTNVVIS